MIDLFRFYFILFIAHTDIIVFGFVIWVLHKQFGFHGNALSFCTQCTVNIPYMPTCKIGVEQLVCCHFCLFVCCCCCCCCYFTMLIWKAWFNLNLLRSKLQYMGKLQNPLHIHLNTHPQWHSNAYSQQSVARTQCKTVWSSHLLQCFIVTFYLNRLWTEVY